MSLIENSSIYYINSANRTSGNDSDFTYAINIPPDSKYNKVCLLQASIPKSYYLVRDNEVFQLDEDVIAANITVPPGNYGRKSFATTLSNLLTNLSPHGWTYVVTFPN